MATSPVYVDLVNGNDANDGSSFAQRMKTIAAATSNTKMSNGGTCRVMGTAYPTDLSQQATWTDGSATITLASALTSLLYDCTTAWTALSANVTTDTNVANQKGGSAARSVLVTTAFITGQACYKDTGTINASGYDSLTFWIKTSTAVAANSIRIETYTNTGGTGVDKTFDIPFATVANRWHPVTIQNAAMSSAVKGIGINILVDVGTNCTITLQNINACNYASLHLQTYIGKNTAGETWAPIAYISGTTLKIDQGVNSVATALYAGTTETVEAWVRFPPNVATQTQGNATTPTISGGWDTTNMSTQDGETWCSFSNLGNTNPINIAIAGTTMDRISFVAGGNSVAWNVTGAGGLVSNSHIINNSSTSFQTARTVSLSNVWMCYGAAAAAYSGTTTNTIGVSISDLVLNSNAAASVFFGTTYGLVLTRVTVRRNTLISSLFTALQNSKINTLTVSDNTGSPAFTNCSGLEITNYTASNNSAYGGVFSICGDITIIKPTTNGNTTGAFQFIGGGAQVLLIEPSIAESTIYTATSSGGMYPDIRIQSFGGTATDHRSYFQAGTVLTDTTNRYTASGEAYKISPTSANATTNLPIWFTLATLPVASSGTVTFTCRIMRNSASISARLRLLGGTIGGVTNDVTASATETPYTVTGGTNATPIVATLSTTGTIANGDVLQISGVTGNTNMNAMCVVTNWNAGAKTFDMYDLDGNPIAGNGAFGGASPIACKYELVTLTFSPTEQNGVAIRAEAYGGTTNSAWFHSITAAQS